MNRIYKVIYSKARQCCMVVSELAKSSHKNSRKGADHVGTPALARMVAAVLVAGTLTWGGVPGVSWAADNTTVKDNNENTVTNTDKNIKDINANITGKGNTVIDSSNAEIVGDGNTVTNEAKGEDDSVRYVRSNDARIHGSGNTISASRNQQVIGDNNTIMGRDDGTVTDYQHPEGREPNVSDLTIGRGNFIRSTDTYRNEWDSLKVIGNNNRADFNIESAGGPAAGIVIGDNQNIDGIQDSIVIGSLSPSEQQLSPSGKPKGKNEIGDLYSVGANSIIIGYHTKIKQYGEGIVVGNRSQGSGIYQTIMGSRSIIGSDTSDPYSGSGAIASIYGAFNKIEDASGSVESAADVDGVGNSINGSLNITSNARGAMIMGVGNTVTHAKGPDILGKDEDTPGATGYWVASGLYGASYYAQGADTVAEGNNLNISFDEMRNSWQKYMETSGGAVSVLGNSNNADYAIRSQILGTGNTITGSEKNMSAYNTVSGFANTGTNIKRSAIVGTGNTLKNGEDNVVIGDYHNLENGKHNVILGSMDYTEKQVTKQSKSAWAMTEEHPDGTFEYTVTEQVPVKDHTKDIENAVMVGYNTDATEDGSVALGSDSIASTKAGIEGYDAQGKKHAKSDKDYAAWVSTDAAVSVGGADREVTYDVLDKDGKPVIDKATGKTKQETQIVKSTRQITGVAAGTNATDAVNVAQLKVTATAAADAVKTHFYSVKSTDTKAGNYNNDGAKGENAIAAGVGAFSDGDSSIAVGTNAKIESNGVSLTSIAIGKNAYVLNGSGNQEYQFSFDKDNWPAGKPNEKGTENLPGGIAIGTNTYARTGSIDVGGRTMKGRQMAGITIDKDGGPSTANIMDMTTVGTNSYNKGLMATIVGSYSINTGDFNGKGGLNSYFYGSQNMGSTIVGSLNQNRSLGKGGTSGVANSIIGVANVAEGANGALIFGAGNKVSNSNKSISGFDGNYGADTVDDLVNSLSSAVKDSESGGSTLVIGGGNTADYTQRTQIIGVNNTITGTSKKISDYNMVDGFNTMANNISHVYTIGYRNDFNNENNSVVIGDYHQMTNGKNNVVIGSYDGSYDKKTKKTTYLTNDNLEDAVMIGHNADVQKNGGVALGADSVAKGKNSLAAGVGALANGSNSVAIGTKAKAQNDALAVGENANAGNNGIAIGMHANAGYGQNMALGYYASVANGVSNSTALGYGSQVTKRDILPSDGSDGVISVGKSVGQSGEKGMTRRIINVKAGVNDTDAVNVSQLKQRAQAATTEVVAGTNIASVTKNDKTADGHTIYTVNAKGTTVSGDDNFNITSKTDDATNVTDYAISLKNTITIGGGKETHPITINGTDGVVSGLTNTTWDKNADYSKSTKAATEAQLQRAMKDAQEAAEANDTDTHVKAGTYAVTTVKDADGKDTQGVALDVVDKTSTPVGKVTITDVAKASDVGDVSQLSKEVQNAKGSTTVVDAINNVNTKVNTVDKKVGNLQYGAEGQTNVVTNGDSVTKAIGDLDKAIGDASTEAGKHTIVSTEDPNLTVKNIAKTGKAANYQLALNKDITVDSVTTKTVTSDTVTTKNLSVSESASIGDVTINKGKQGTIDGLKNTAWDAQNITSGRAATEDQVKAATKNAVNYDGDSDSDNGKNITLREDTTIKNVADTTIEQGSKNAVNAGTVYNETRVEKDGTFIRQANTAGENLTALDNQVTSNTQNINYLNGRVGELGDRINKVGAGAAALAALHPLDFDPDDKWDFAAGVGNYRNATAAAVGLFYRPNERTMFNLGWTMGDNRNMVNGGFSVKFGKSNKYVKYSKAEMASVIDSQSREIAELKAKDVQNAKDNAEMRAEIEALKKQVEALAAKK